jgi:hypothetical protein
MGADVLLGNGLAVGVGYNRRNPAGAGLLGRGNGLWNGGTVGIIGMNGKTVHPRRRQKKKESAYKANFHAPFT